MVIEGAFKVDDLFNKLNLVYVSDILLTVFVIALFIGLERLSNKYASKKKWSSEKMRLRVHTHIRNIYLFIIAIFVITIWIPQIQSFAISIAAIAVAVVVSLKEIIMLFTGVFIRTTADLLTVGDRIEINGLKGDVIRAGFITTDLLEIGNSGQRTGRITAIPNSYFLLYPVINESAVGNFTFHTIILPILPEHYRHDMKRMMLEFSKEITHPYIKNSPIEFKKFDRKNTANSISSDPRIVVHIYSSEEYLLALRLVVPIREKVKIEQTITEKFIEIQNC